MLVNHFKNKKMKNNSNPSGQRGLSITFVWLAVTFCVCLIISNIFVPRTWQLWGLPIQLTGGIVIFPVSYIINDCLTEVYGYRKARLVIWMGFLLSVFVALVSALVCSLPAPLYEENRAVAESFNSFFGLVPRTTIASLLAFFFGSTANAWVMSKMKLASEKGRGFGWRAIVSSVVGETCDSLIFFPVVFLGVMPITGILGIMLTQIVAKTMYEVIILPVTSLIVRYLKKRENLDTYDYNISYNPFNIADVE